MFNIIDSRFSHQGGTPLRRWHGNDSTTTGFTLIEMLISITIFMLFLGIVSGSYTTLVSANRDANQTQRIYREVRNVFDIMSREVRNGDIDYECLTSIQDVSCLENMLRTPRKILGIKHKNGTKRSLYRFDSDSKKFLILSQERSESETKPVWRSISSWQPLTSTAVPIEDFDFSVFPELDPYDQGNAAIDSIQFQPSLRLRLKTHGYEFKATYSSRNYVK